MTEKDKDFLEGLAISAACHVLPARKVFREPIAYSYNGVILPALPEWDRERYPYAYITYWSSFGEFSLFTHEKRPIAYTQHTESGDWLTIGTPEGCEVSYWGTVSPGNKKGWDGRAEPITTRNSEGSALTSKEVVLWTNTDILNEDGTVFQTTSEPIPVYE